MRHNACVSYGYRIPLHLKRPLHSTRTLHSSTSAAGVARVVMAADNPPRRVAFASASAFTQRRCAGVATSPRRRRARARRPVAVVSPVDGSATPSMNSVEVTKANGTAETVAPAETGAVPVKRTNGAARVARSEASSSKRKRKVNDTAFCTMYETRPLASVLIVHCGGTFGMDPKASFEEDGSIVKGTGGSYKSGLRPGGLLADILEHVPELRTLANLDVTVAMNIDSARVGPVQWVKIAKVLHKNRTSYDAFVIIHGTDTLCYTAAALSLMLAGFGRPVVLTGSQLPMLMPRSDARQNLIDAVSCATDGVLEEFAICFGGTLLRGNRALKASSTSYRAFASPTHPPLASLGVDIEWDRSALWKDPGVYRPRFNLEPSVIRIPVVPGVNPNMSYGDLFGRGIRGAVIESFGVGNMPDTKSAGWMDWLRKQRKAGLEVYLASQCTTGPLNPELYRSGSTALSFGATSSRRMTSETAVVKMMLCLSYQDLHLSYPLAGEI